MRFDQNFFGFVKDRKIINENSLKISKINWKNKIPGRYFCLFKKSKLRNKLSLFVNGFSGFGLLGWTGGEH